MTNRKWLIGTISSLIVCILLICTVNVYIDPFFHYHKPITKYRLYEERYINDGIARNFDYDSIIIGNSLTQNFKKTQFDTLFNANSIKIPYSGAGYMEIWKAIDKALANNSRTSRVLVGMDLEDLDRNSDWRRYDSSPEYLYDDNLLNDVNYLLNKETLYRGTFYNVMMTLRGQESTTFDEYSSWERPQGAEHVLAGIGELVEKTDVLKIREQDRDKIRKNVYDNMIPVIGANPTVSFTLIIPPNSIGKWALYYKDGEVAYRIDGLESAFEVLLEYDNVEIYAFDDEYDLTTDMSRYSDSIHYDAGVNEWMLDEISMGHHKVTRDNYTDYINQIKDYYCTYDYVSLNEYM